MTNARATAISTKGLVIHWAARYDMLAWLLTRGGEKRFRRRIIALANLRGGESILDVGCGTGTLAIVAAGADQGGRGRIVGVDASPEMIARARRKAAAARVDVAFEQAAAEALPFDDASFDVCFGTLMLHHLPRPTRVQCLREVRRILKPDGRFIAVDFGRPQGRHGLLAHFHRHGHVALVDVAAMVGECGLTVTSRGALGWSDLEYLVARVSA
jgi:ubiquinone/menaquinone biosynthesis C-methylase UbiE